jgi:hypothetical protein
LPPTLYFSRQSRPPAGVTNRNSPPVSASLKGFSEALAFRTAVSVSGKGRIAVGGSPAVPPTVPPKASDVAGPLRTLPDELKGKTAGASSPAGRYRTKPERHLVPWRGLEPPRCYPLVPETSASTNSATRARASSRGVVAGMSTAVLREASCKAPSLVGLYRFGGFDYARGRGMAVDRQVGAP